jgi:glycosyltransferase involved in cell wall biosynthesis
VALQTPRVVIVFDWFWKYAAGQADALRRAGVPVALLHRTHAYEFAGRADERDKLLEQSKRAGIASFPVPGRFRSASGWSRVIPLHRRVAAWGPDLVHAHDNYDPRLLTLTRGLPCLLTVHDPVPHSGAAVLRGARARVRAAWLRRADRIVVHSRRLADALPAGFPRERIAIIPHGVDVAVRPTPVPEQPAVLLFGRLEAYKGVHVLVEAMRLVWRVRPDVRLIVAGAGPEIARLPRDPRVELSAGYVPEAGLKALFGRASVVSLAYLDGSQSAVGLQAVARGIPAVVSDVGALAELACDPTLVVPPGQPAALSQALLRALESGADLRERVLEHARRTFSWHVVTRQALALYREVLSR